MTDIEMLPLPEWCHGCGESLPRDMQTYARAVAEHNVKALQAELDNRWAQGVHTCHDKCQRIACVLRRDNKRLAEALRDLEPFAQHHDSCGDHDAYNNSPIRTCGCGLDSLLERIAALRDHDQEGKDG